MVRQRWICDLVVITAVVYLGVGAGISVLKEKIAPEPTVTLAGGSKSKPQPRSIPPLAAYRVIVERALFGREEAAAEAERGPEEVNLEEIPLAARGLGLRLVGTVVGEHPADNVAIIEEQKTRKQDAYREGERVGEVLIKKILRQQVVINTGIRDEMLAMEVAGEAAAPKPTGAQPAAPPTPGGAPGPIPLDSDELEASLGNINQLMQQARIRPFMEGNKPAGFLVTDIKPGSLFAKMGLRNGDVIRRVNEEEITSPEQAIELYRGLMEGGELALEIRRGHRRQQLVYEIR